MRVRRVGRNTGRFTLQIDVGPDHERQRPDRLEVVRAVAAQVGVLRDVLLDLDAQPCQLLLLLLAPGFAGLDEEELDFEASGARSRAALSASDCATGSKETPLIVMTGHMPTLIRLSGCLQKRSGALSLWHPPFLPERPAHSSPLGVHVRAGGHGRAVWAGDSHVDRLPWRRVDGRRGAFEPRATPLVTAAATRSPGSASPELQPPWCCGRLIRAGQPGPARDRHHRRAGRSAGRIRGGACDGADRHQRLLADVADRGDAGEAQQHVGDVWEPASGIGEKRANDVHERNQVEDQLEVAEVALALVVGDQVGG